MSKSSLEQFLISVGITPTGDKKKDMKLAAKIVPKYKGKAYSSDQINTCLHNKWY